jgi:hypothetical protein
MLSKTSLRVWEGAAEQVTQKEEELEARWIGVDWKLEHKLFHKQLGGTFRQAEPLVVSMPPCEVSEVVFGLDGYAARNTCPHSVIREV